MQQHERRVHAHGAAGAARDREPSFEPLIARHAEAHATKRVEAPAFTSRPKKPPVIEPLAPTRYRVQFTASAALRGKLERLRALLPGCDL